MTSERTKELEHVNKMIREMLETHNCTIYVTEDLRGTIITANENPGSEYIFASGLIKKF